MSTGHGNSVKGMLRRLEAMYLMSADIPLEAIRAQIVEGIDIMIHLGRYCDGTRKVLEIAELCDYENSHYVINPLFFLNEKGEQEYTGNPLVKRSKLAGKGYENSKL